MKDKDIHLAVSTLKSQSRNWDLPSVDAVAKKKRDPFRVLISCILSLRTKDEVTHQAGTRLFDLADTPHSLLRISESKIARTIYPVGFYNRKAHTIRSISREVLDRFDGEVPGNLEDLLSLPGVGRKTANLVLTVGYKRPGICVDTHVHRITNRWGYVATRNPDQTETALREKLPRPYWLIINTLLVSFGKRICTPISPHCSDCPIARCCARVDVGRSR